MVKKQDCFCRFLMFLPQTPPPQQFKYNWSSSCDILCLNDPWSRKKPLTLLTDWHQILPFTSDVKIFCHQTQKEQLENILNWTWRCGWNQQRLFEATGHVGEQQKYNAAQKASLRHGDKLTEITSTSCVQVVKLSAHYAVMWAVRLFSRLLSVHVSLWCRFTGVYQDC